MIQSRRRENPSAQPEPESKRKRFRLDFGIWQLLLGTLGAFFALAWMFIFGLLVGRDVPLIDRGEVSFRAHVLAWMGLQHQAAPHLEDTAQTWENPKKMLENLDYGQTLGKKPDPSSLKPTPHATVAPQVQPPSEAAAQKPKTTPSPSPTARVEKGSPTESRKTVRQEKEPSEPSADRFSVMAASLKDIQNARTLMDQLRAKGYAPRLESVDMPGSGRWNRVLIGSFSTMEEAQQFMTEFNRKERQQGSIVRTGR